MWDTALPQFWQVAHETIAGGMQGADPKIVEALTDDVIEGFRIQLCGEYTFKRLKQKIDLRNWRALLRDKSLNAVDLHRESIAAGDYWRLRPLKQGDPQAWVDIRLNTDKTVENACKNTISSHSQAVNWMPVWRSNSDELIEAITSEFRRNGIHRCFSWDDLNRHLWNLAAFRIRDLLIRKTKQALLQASESGDEDWDVFWRKRDPGYLSPASPESPDAQSNFARQDLLELFKAAGVPSDFASMVIENKCDGTPVKELSQRLAEPPSLATVYTRMQDAMDAVKQYASDPDNQRRWRGTSVSEATKLANPACGPTGAEQSNAE